MSGAITTPFTKSSDVTFTLAIPAVKIFEWTGGDMTSVNVRLKSEMEDVFIPEVIAVVEKYGCVDWLTMGNSLSFPAHKIISLIVSPTPDSEFLTAEITRGMETESVFKKNVNTFEGAIIPIK